MTRPKFSLSVRPGAGGKVYYLPLGAKSRDHEERVKLCVRLKLRHVDPDHRTLTITGIAFAFPGTDLGFRTMWREQENMIPKGGVLARGDTVMWMNGTAQGQTDAEEDKFNHIYLDGPAPPQLRIDVHCEGFDQPFSKTFDLIPLTDPTGSGPLLLPFITNNLDDDEYVAAQAFHFYDGRPEGTQMFAHDMGIEARVNGVWTAARTAETPTRNEDIRIFGRPVRSMADGEVFEVADNWADNPYKQQLPKTDPRYGGNYVRVRYGDLEVKYVHLKSGSVIVSPGEEVTAGQKLAECGNSGNTGGDPHLHIECRVTGHHTLCPFTFRNTWMLARDLVPHSGNGRRVRLDGRGICQEYAALRPFATGHGPLGPHVSDVELDVLVADILAGAARRGDGTALVGERLVKLPPRGAKAALLKALVGLDALTGAAATKRRQQIAGAIDKAMKGLKDGGQ